MPVTLYDVDNDEKLTVEAYVWFRDDSQGVGVWRPGKVIGTTEGTADPEARQVIAEVDSRRPTGMTLSLGTLAISNIESATRQRFWSYRIQAEDYPYEVVSISQRQLRAGGENGAAECRIAVEQHGTLVKWGTGTLQTGIVDTFAFATGLQIVLDAVLSREQAEKGKFILNIFAAIWSLPVATVGVRQGYIAVNDWQYRSTADSLTLSANGALNLLSAISGFTGSVGTLTQGDQALVAVIGSRLSVGLWTVTQAIDFFKALAKIYQWYNDPLRDQKPISPDVATAVKTFVTMVGGGMVTGTTALPQAIALAIAAAGSLGGSVAIYVAKTKVKQD